MACAMATNDDLLQKLVLTVADANSAIDKVIRSNVLSLTAAQEVLLLLEESIADIRQIFPFAVPHSDGSFGEWVGNSPENLDSPAVATLTLCPPRRRPG
jgi:hypothetical protein